MSETNLDKSEGGGMFMFSVILSRAYQRSNPTLMAPFSLSTKSVFSFVFAATVPSNSFLLRKHVSGTNQDQGVKKVTASEEQCHV
jgi:hypothetical protein